MAYDPSLKIVQAFLDPETRKALSLPLAALITAALSQVETTIEITNRPEGRMTRLISFTAEGTSSTSIKTL